MDAVNYRSTKISYWFILGFFILLIPLGLTTPFFTIIFSLLVLQALNFKNYRILSIILFLAVVSIIFTSFGYFANRAVTAIPEIAEKAIPEIVQIAASYDIALPFNDVDSFNDTVVNLLEDQLAFVANFASVASKEFIYFLIGILIAVGLFITPTLSFDLNETQPKNTLYLKLCSDISYRFKNMFFSFKQVMGAQIIISIINTLFTGIFLYAEGLPHFEFLTAMTFLCGLFPIIGNIISNMIIFCVAMTVSSTMALHALAFLVILHKFEYFLNSRIIGGKINNPMWLTLVSLLIGERLMGLPGLILAPILLNFIKIELSKTIL